MTSCTIYPCASFPHASFGTPQFAQATLYPAGFGGAPLARIVQFQISSAHSNSRRDSISLHIKAGAGECEGKTSATEKAEKAGTVMTVDLEIEDLRTLAKVLGYNLTPAE